MRLALFPPRFPWWAQGLAGAGDPHARGPWGWEPLPATWGPHPFLPQLRVKGAAAGRGRQRGAVRVPRTRQDPPGRFGNDDLAPGPAPAPARPRPQGRPRPHQDLAPAGFNSDLLGPAPARAPPPPRAAGKAPPPQAGPAPRRPRPADCAPLDPRAAEARALGRRWRGRSAGSEPAAERPQRGAPSRLRPRSRHGRGGAAAPGAALGAAGAVRAAGGPPGQPPRPRAGKGPTGKLRRGAGRAKVGGCGGRRAGSGPGAPRGGAPCPADPSTPSLGVRAPPPRPVPTECPGRGPRPSAGWGQRAEVRPGPAPSSLRCPEQPPSQQRRSRGWPPPGSFPGPPGAPLGGDPREPCGHCGDRGRSRAPAPRLQDAHLGEVQAGWARLMRPLRLDSPGLASTPIK